VHGIRSFAGVPLVARGSLLGVLCVNYRKARNFEGPEGRRDKELVDLFAQQASSVIASGQLARERERKRLEDDIHNLVKSAMLALLSQCREARSAVTQGDGASVTARLIDLQRAAQGVLSDVQMILTGLPALEFEHRALDHLIREDLRRLLGTRQPRLKVALDESLPALPVPLTRALLALLREGVINAFEHSQGREIRVSAGRHGRWLWLRVADDGTGIALPMAVLGEQQHGRVHMQRQVERLGGRLRIKSSSYGGTLVRFAFPLPEEEAV
jgi:signal transduction histidine kinase